MFIGQTITFANSSEERQRGFYLQLVMSAENHQDDYTQYRAIVRKVTVVPFGNFSAVSKIVVGARAYHPVYGQTIVVHPDVFELCVPIPTEYTSDVELYQHSSEARQRLAQWARRNLTTLRAPIVSTKGRRLRQTRLSEQRPVQEPSLPGKCTVCNQLTWVFENYCDNCGADLVEQLNRAAHNATLQTFC